MKKATNTTKNTASEHKTDSRFTPPGAGAASNLRALFIASLKDIYWAENALVKALPKMAANATDALLRSSLHDHLAVTENQIARLKKVFEMLGEKAEGKKCDAMAGLIEEGNGLLEETEPGPVRDAGIIAASQKIEHYEIATYGTLFSFAKVLGENDAAQLLQQTLAEEIEADKILTDVAVSSINAAADKI